MTLTTSPTGAFSNCKRLEALLAGVFAGMRWGDTVRSVPRIIIGSASNASSAPLAAAVGADAGNTGATGNAEAAGDVAGGAAASAGAAGADSAGVAPG